MTLRIDQKEAQIRDEFPQFKNSYNMTNIFLTFSISSVKISCYQMLTIERVVVNSSF